MNAYTKGAQEWTRALVVLSSVKRITRKKQIEMDFYVAFCLRHINAGLFLHKSTLSMLYLLKLLTILVIINVDALYLSLCTVAWDCKLCSHRTVLVLSHKDCNFNCRECTLYIVVYRHIGGHSNYRIFLIA